MKHKLLKKTIAVMTVIAICFLTLISGGSKTRAANEFNDVKDPSAWYYTTVYKIVSTLNLNGTPLMSGYANGSGNFGPADLLTRQDFAVILHRLANGPAIPIIDNPFKDTDPKGYYYNSVLWTKDTNVIAGYNDGRFGVGDPITREQVATILYRFAKDYLKLDTTAAMTAGDLSKFQDGKNVSTWAEKALTWATGAGIITGKANGTKVDAWGNAARAEIGAMILRFINYKNQQTRYNFVIFGIDDVGYTQGDKNRSDMIMIASIDPEACKINLISVLRDSKVPIEGYLPQKINKAYQAGGAKLALKTINDAFHTNLDKYITLNWQDVVFLVDDIGGIEVEITQEEAEQINQMIALDASREGRNKKCVAVSEGVAHLDGTQALHFSRIRKIDSDYFRAGRQHRTLKAIQQKVQTISASEYLALATDLMITNRVETNLTVDDVMEWMNKDVVKYKITSTFIPGEEYESYGKNIFIEDGPDDDTEPDECWVWDFDLDKAAQRLLGVLFE